MLTEEEKSRIIAETKIKAIRSSGPGGQHVNKTSTKVEVRFNIEASVVFTDEQKQLLREKLAVRLNAEGELVLVSQTTRSQLKNKEEAIEKLLFHLQKALTPKKKRKATRPTKASKEARLKTKKALSEKKQWRQKPGI